MTEFTDGLDQSQPKSIGEALGKADQRMTQEDVDVLDNLINAQAAFWEAIGAAADHLEMDASDIVVDEMIKAMMVPMGLILMAFAIKRT